MSRPRRSRTKPASAGVVGAAPSSAGRGRAPPEGIGPTTAVAPRGRRGAGTPPRSPLSATAPGDPPASDGCDSVSPLRSAPASVAAGSTGVSDAAGVRGRLRDRAGDAGSTAGSAAGLATGVGTSTRAGADSCGEGSGSSGCSSYSSTSANLGPSTTGGGGSGSAARPPKTAACTATEATAARRSLTHRHYRRGTTPRRDPSLREFQSL